MTLVYRINKEVIINDVVLLPRGVVRLPAHKRSVALQQESNGPAAGGLGASRDGPFRIVK